MSHIHLNGEDSRTNYDPFSKTFKNKPWRNKVTIDDKLTITCKHNIEFYVVMDDRIYLMIDSLSLDYYKRLELKQRAEGHVGLKSLEGEKDLNNLFCYDKNTGQQLWQVQNIDDSPFTRIGVNFKDKIEKGRDYEIPELEGKQIGTIIKKKFEKGRDLFGGTTFHCISYTIDIDTGEATFYKQGK